MNTFSVVNDNGLKFNVRIVLKGDKFGRNDCLTHEDNDPLIEFYDDRYPHTQHGQFVARYGIDVLLGLDVWIGHKIGLSERGLDLDGGIDDWSLDANACIQVTRHLEFYQRSVNG